MSLKVARTNSPALCCGISIVLLFSTSKSLTGYGRALFLRLWTGLSCKSLIFLLLPDCNVWFDWGLRGALRHKERIHTPSHLSSLIERAREGARATVAKRKVPAKRKFETFLQTSDAVVNPRPRGIRLCRLRHATWELSHGAEDGGIHLRRRDCPPLHRSSRYQGRNYCVPRGG